MKTGHGMATVYAAPEAVGHLKTEQGTSKFTLPPETISKLKVGDRVAFEIKTAQEAVAEAER